MNHKAVLFFCALILPLIWGCSNSVGPEDDVIPSTTISFSLVETSHVDLWIENAYQTKVLTLVDEEREAGNYEVSFDMIDSNGNRLPDGIYTYHLKVDDDSLSRILILGTEQ
jgi:hypothetical protein